MLSFCFKIHSTSLIYCPLCPWYSFCPGCIIDPRKEIILSSKYGIVVDWCYSFVEEELQPINFQMYKEIDSQIISENLPIIDKEQNYQSIKDCFDLFFEEENLEDPLYCHKCQGPEDFSKRYSINKLPYVLILSLKRFKFNKNSNFKLRQMITYPLYDLEIGNENMKKKYDLYGIINHYGSISGGHYTAIVKDQDNEWTLCNDSRVYKIEENRVMHSNAYILFYICKESPYQNDYIKFMKSIMNNMTKKNIIVKEDKDKKKISFIKDLNFFKGEPVKTKYGEGYVVKENLVNFKFDEKYDIYEKLKKEDDLRVENLNKKYKKEDNKTNKPENENEKDIKDNDKKNNEEKNENDKKDAKDKDNNKNNEENNKKGEEEKNKNDDKKDANENKEDNNKKGEEEKNKNEINEIIEESDKKENSENTEENKKDQKDNETNKNKIIENDETNNLNEETGQTEKGEIETNLNVININKINDKEKKDINKSLPEYYKDFLEIKFDYGKGWIHKKNVKKYNVLELKEEEKTKKGGGLFSMFK